MIYNEKEVKNILNISKGIIFKEERVVIFKNGEEVALSNKQLYGLLRKLQIYLEVDERCIDRDGPQFKLEKDKFIQLT
jgi:hypothetical protein